MLLAQEWQPAEPGIPAMLASVDFPLEPFYTITSGTVTTTLAQQGANTGVYTYSIAWTADGDGALSPVQIEADNFTKIHGLFLVQVETIPGGTAPTALYDIAINDTDGADLLGGAGADRSATLPEIAYPSVISKVIANRFSVVLTSNTQAGATGTIRLYFSRTPITTSRYQWHATTIAVDWNASNVQYIQLASGAQTFVFANPLGAGRYVLIAKQPAAGGAGTASWPVSVLWSGGSAPTLTATNSKVDILIFIYDSVNAKYYGSYVTNF
jgi:hypothetical protein